MSKAKTDAPIAIFDSGIGGLTVFKEIRKILPYENLIYFGDTARVPYGNKSSQTIKRFACEITRFLNSFNAKMIVVACNTVSSIAIKEVERISRVPVIGVIEPGAEKALKTSRRKKIAVIGTSATIESHAYRNILKKMSPDCNVKEKACPLFVPLVEEGWWYKYSTRLIVREYLREFKNKYYDTLILGCTHYPFLKRLINEELKGVNVIDSAIAVSQKVYEELSRNNSLGKNKHGYSKFIVSDSPLKFKELAEKLLGIKIKKVYVKRL